MIEMFGLLFAPARPGVSYRQLCGRGWLGDVTLKNEEEFYVN